MPSQNSKTRAVIPGKAILGVAGAAKAEAANLGGAVVPGRAILGDKAAQENARAIEARAAKKAADPKAAAGPAVVEPPALAIDSALPPRLSPTAPVAPSTPAGLSEKEAEELLVLDPNAWSEIMDLEAERPDGMRPAVARVILAVADRATDNPVPADVLERMTALAG